MNKEFDGVQEIQEIRSTTVNYALVAMAVLAAPALIASLVRTVDIGWQNIFYLHIGVIVIVWITAALRHKLPYQIRSLILLAVILTLGIAGLISFGLLGAGNFS